MYPEEDAKYRNIMMKLYDNNCLRKIYLSQDVLLYTNFES